MMRRPQRGEWAQTATWRLDSQVPLYSRTLLIAFVCRRYLVRKKEERKERKGRKGRKGRKKERTLSPPAPSGVPQRGREKPPVESPLGAARCQVGSSGQWPGPLAAMSPEHQSAAEESWGPGQRNRLVVLMGLGDAPQWALSFLPVTSCRARALSQRRWGSALAVAVVRRDPHPRGSPHRLRSGPIRSTQ